MNRILIIDDEKMITSTLSILIEMMLGYNVSVFNSPIELMKSGFLENNKIDLVISDFIMPGMNGIELLENIKMIQPDVVSILLTGYSDKESAIKSINELGLYYYLEKPWDNNDLIKIVKNGVEKKHLEDELKNKMVIIEKRNHEITRLYDILQRDYNKEIAHVLDFVMTLSNLIEAKDIYTDGHTRRVSSISRELGILCNLEEKRLASLEISAIIHDIGKVGTPDHILNKPSKLTDEEYEKIKEHPELGANIIRPLTPLSDCISPVLKHHEKLDGSGYPYGLYADDIEIEARIISIADIFDALFTIRPYRKALSIDEVINIIRTDVNLGKLDKDLFDKLLILIENGTINSIYT
jgi:response regulator RpfG family c-di-GMP phosphodiesterase